jgi:glycogen(starch) synthase
MLTWDFPPGSAGGIAAHVGGLASAMAAAGHDVVLVTRADATSAPDGEIRGVRVLRADVDMPWLPDDGIAATASGNHAFVAATAQLGDWRPDVIHAHDWRVAWAGDVLATLWDRPLVTTLHGTERGRHGGHLPPGAPTDINSVEWWLAFRSRRIITSTKLMVREIVGGFELDPNVVSRIPNGIEPEWWQSRTDDVTPSGALAAADPLVMTWGRVQYEKGFQTLVRAIGSLRNRVPGIQCVVAGRGSYLPDLQSQVDVEGLGDLVHLPGFVPDVELRSAIHRAACVVIPSLYEPFGIVALEALAGGAPLIVADTGGLAELVGGSGSALLFEPGNAGELADRIELLLTDTELAAAMRIKGAELLRATYSWDAIAARTADVYAGVCVTAR